MRNYLPGVLLITILVPAVSFAKKPIQTPQPGHVVWADANGVMIGDAQTDVRPETANIYFQIDGDLYLARMLNGELTGGNSPVEVVYDQPGCTGNAYLRAREVIGGVDILRGYRDGIFYAATSDALQGLFIGSWWDNDQGKCAHPNQLPYPNDAYPAAPLKDTNIYSKPYTLKLIPAK